MLPLVPPTRARREAQFGPASSAAGIDLHIRMAKEAKTLAAAHEGVQVMVEAGYRLGVPQNLRTKRSVVHDCVVVHNDVTIAALDWKIFAAILKKSRSDQLKSHMPGEWGSVPVFGQVFRR